MPVSSPARKRNALWPLRRGSKGWRTGTIAERYAAALRHLVRTPKGSIVTAPDFGTEIHLLRTQGISGDDEALQAAELQEAISRYIPDITLLGVGLEAHPGTEELDVNISWGIIDASNVGTRSAKPSFAFGPVKTTITV